MAIAVTEEVQEIQPIFELGCVKGHEIEAEKLETLSLLGIMYDELRHLVPSPGARNKISAHKVPAERCPVCQAGEREA